MNLMILLSLLFLVSDASAQTCSQIGSTFYCDSREGSTIISPLGKDRGVIMRPRGELDTYSTMPSGKSSQIYIDPEHQIAPSSRERSPYSVLPETRSRSRSSVYETDEYGLPK